MKKKLLSVVLCLVLLVTLVLPVAAEFTESPELPALAIVTEPVSYQGSIGSTAIFSIVVNRPDVTYQWWFSNNNGNTWNLSTLSGSDADSIAVLFKAYRDGQQYKCIVIDSTGASVESVIVDMTLGAFDLEIVANPQNYTGRVGSTATLTVEAKGNGLTYQWYYTNNNGATWSKSSMPGSNTNAVSVLMSAARVGQMYKCVVTDEHGNMVESTAAKLDESLEVITNPSDYTGPVGSSGSFSVEAYGSGLTYQWMYSNNNGASWSKSTMEGATTANVIVPLKAFRDGQLYKCVITNANGSVVETNPVAIRVG